MEKAAINERELVSRAQGGDLRSFSALVEKYQERAVHIAYSLVGNFEDAKDLAQESFVKAYSALQSFKGDSKFYTWFYRILANTCKDFMRKQAFKKGLVSWVRGEQDEAGERDIFEGIGSEAYNGSRELLRGELREAIQKAIDSLPAQQKSVFALRYLEGLPLAEIAESLNLSEGAVKAHLWQAGQKMRKLLKGFVSTEEV